MFALLLLTCAAADGGSKLDLKPGWKAAGELKSEFATQAAAADERRVYAVSNGTVAVYDRATGKLLAKSEGEAKHLNSAFLKDGKVYCAHSNYPTRPEASEVRAYDPATNTLTVFHDFKNPPGSLVWNVHDGKRWWCCFAHYQADNAKTVLVRYGDGWKEEARWTFPAKVVADWDGMSASGGVWDGDTLLVSHHHFKVLYRLRLPKDGAELEFVEALACPFPGQGVAADPKTGGLVGIDRAARKVVFAAK
ncbi:MAG: endonuclease [Isosphaera sp.]|nr:endonuclease [Isosphaera sp.]